MKNDQSKALRLLTMPCDVKVEQYPVMDLYTYLSYFRPVKQTEETFSYIPDNDLTFVERTWDLNGMSLYDSNDDM
ncbi:hypothetical protein BaRGS_00025007 [Batillaria attramentaria]|uniref:Uncharacterized protein n=1 Tax=Batillaria attramentaria TaxID=370345 RepID=A0ABD0K9J2_9CAEN